MKSVARLYTQFQPKQYAVTFDIDEDAMRFSGIVKIKGKKVGRPSQRITLHAVGLKISSAKITKHDKKGDQELPVTRINLQKTLNEVRLHTEQMVYPGEYSLELTFEAPITDGMTGVYPCYYKAVDGTEKQLIATQFESHHAREAFPCVDEPEAKAVFQLSLITRAGITALGNTPVAEQKAVTSELVSWSASVRQDQLTSTPVQQLTSFEPTPRMSTYLLAFVLGDMHSKSVKTNRGTEVSIWATKAQPIESFDFALDVGKRSIEFFEDYFGTDYPLAKADHVALPDFSSAAMENWGLITYREQYLLAYPGETSQELRERIAVVIAHETSHQWFGNLVTMKWWDELWLNESFANMMEYQATDAMFPEWHIWNTFIAGEGLSAFRRDSLAGVQAVKVAVHHPDEISSLFDPSIVYAKGGRLLYMLKNYIGEEAFRSGLKTYFETHAYANTQGSDLWAELSKASGKDIATFMNPWLERSGFPVIHVKQYGTQLTLEQEHFLDNPSKADPNRLWTIPLFSTAPTLPDALSKQSLTVQVSNEDTLLNVDSRGHYIVHYVTAEQKKYVVDKIATQELSEADRLMLLNGGSMLARAGYEPYGNILTMLSAYKDEASEPVWDIMALIVGEARRFIDLDETLEPHIKIFVEKLTAPQVTRLGWESPSDETSADQKLRALILGLSAYAENKATVAKAIELFAAYKDSNVALPAELRALVFIIPIKNGDKEAFDFLLQLYDRTHNSELKSDICDALTATRDPKQAAKLLDRLKNSKLVKLQDVDRWLVYLLRNRFIRDVSWDWMVANWQWLENTFQNDKSYDYLPRYAASCVGNRTYQQKYNDLFEPKQNQLILKRNIQLGFEEIENRLTWLERDLISVQAFFKAQQ